jgi:hypothetical protein
MRYSKALLPLLAVCAFVSSATLASAATVFSWYEQTSGTTITSGQLSVAYAGMDGANFKYNMTLTNTSTDQSVLTGFLLRVDPDGVGLVSETSSYNQVAVSNGGYSIDFDFCFQNDGNGSCQGNSPQGVLQAGASESFEMVFSSSEALTFTGAGGRFQVVSVVGSLKLTDACIGNNCQGGIGLDVVVPLPAGLPLLLSALGLGGLLRLRRRKAA